MKGQNFRDIKIFKSSEKMEVQNLRRSNFLGGLIAGEVKLWEVQIWGRTWVILRWSILEDKFF